MPPRNLTARFARNFGACLLVPLICAGRLTTQEISLDLGGGVKMEFVWVPVGGTDGRTSAQIGDQSGAHENETVRIETI